LDIYPNVAHLARDILSIPGLSDTGRREFRHVLSSQAQALVGLRVDNRPGVEEIVQRARQAEGTTVIDFRVEQEDSVYPMVPAGADLDAMIRRPEPSVLVETADDPI
jgi:acetolactate synthase-1/2/3 large subunit